MKTFYFTALLAVFLLIWNNEIPAQSLQTKTPAKVAYFKVSEIRIFINNQADILELRKQGLDFENMKLHDNSFDVMLDSLQLNTLKNTGCT